MKMNLVFGGAALVVVVVAGPLKTEAKNCVKTKADSAVANVRRKEATAKAGEARIYSQGIARQEDL